MTKSKDHHFNKYSSIKTPSVCHRSPSSHISNWSTGFLFEFFCPEGVTSQEFFWSESLDGEFSHRSIYREIVLKFGQKNFPNLKSLFQILEKVYSISQDQGSFVFANKKTSFIITFCTIDLGIHCGTLNNHFGHLWSCLCIKTIDCCVG